MPSTSNYGDLFGGGPMAAYYALGDRDRTYATQKIADQQAQENVRAKQLSNLFDEQNNPQKIAEQGLVNEGKVLANTNQGYLNQMNAVKADISTKTAAEQYSAEQRKLISEASKADMDDLQYKAQMAAQNPLSTPQQREEGVKALKMHSDFLKIQEQYKNDVAKQSNAQAFSREQQARTFAHSDRQVAAKASNVAKLKQGAGDILTAIRTGKIKPADAAAALGVQAMQEERAGNIEEAMFLRQAAAVAESIAVTTRAEPAAKPMLLPEGGIGQTPPRQPTFSGNKAPPPQLPPGWSLK